MARIPGVDQLNKVESKLRDITNSLDRVSTFYDRWSRDAGAVVERHHDITLQMEAVNKAHASGAMGAARHARAITDLNIQLSKMPPALNTIGKLVGGKLLSSFDKLGKSMLMLGLETFRLGINKLENAIVQIYNVHEKWAKLMGEFRNRLGVVTTGMRQLSKVAASVEGTIYGLTGAFGSGAPMVAEFVEGLERVVNVVKGDTFGRLAKEGIMLGRAMGMSAGEVGKMGFMLQQLGEGSEAQRDLFKDIQAGAAAAGVSTASFGKELVQARGFMTSFGSAGRKMFIQMTTYVKSLGVSLKSLEAFTDMTDTFDSTAQSVAKLNTVFGTTISSLEMMLEQDPSKRLEKVRVALLGQGKTFESLSRQERKFLGDTMKLTQEELAGVLSTGKTLDEVQQDQEKARKQAEKDQKNIQRLVSKTATTLFSFAQAWDRVWMAVQRLIRPFTDLIGLTKSGDKQAKSFGQTMKVLFDRFIKFIDEVANNPEWQSFMKKLAGDTKDFFVWMSKTITGGNLTKGIHTLVTGATKFYDMMKSAFETMFDMGKKMLPIVELLVKHIDKIIIGWATMKGLSAVGNAAGGAMKIGSVLGMGGKAGKAGGGMLGKLGKGAMGAVSMAGPWGMAIAGVAALGVAAWKYGSMIERGAPTKLDGAIMEERLNDIRERSQMTESAKLAMDAMVLDRRRQERDLILQGNNGRAEALKYDKERLKQDKAVAKARAAAGLTDLEGASANFDKGGEHGAAQLKFLNAEARMLNSKSGSKEIAALLSGGTQDELTQAAILAGREYESKKASLGVEHQQTKAAKELEMKLTRLSGATSRAAEVEMKSQQIKLKIMESDLLMTSLRSAENVDLANAIAGLKPGQTMMDLWGTDQFARGKNPLLDNLISNKGDINSMLMSMPTMATPAAPGSSVMAGPAARENLANRPSKSAGSRGTVVSSTADVTLDGRKVGSAVVTTFLGAN